MKSKDKIRWILFAIVIVLITSMYNTVPEKMSVASVEGAICSVDEDCVCWGLYDADTNVYGLGTGKCVNGRCDMIWCYDIQPVGEWLRDNPWMWMRENPLKVFGIAVLLLLIIFWDYVVGKDKSIPSTKPKTI